MVFIIIKQGMSSERIREVYEVRVINAVKSSRKNRNGTPDKSRQGKEIIRCVPCTEFETVSSFAETSKRAARSSKTDLRQSERLRECSAGFFLSRSDTNQLEKPTNT